VRKDTKKFHKSGLKTEEAENYQKKNKVAKKKKPKAPVGCTPE